MAAPSAHAKRLRRWIVEQHLLPGSRLPSERDLAQLLSVTRFQARRVLIELEEAGLIRATSPRIRIVAADGSAGSLARTVAVVAPLGTSPAPGQESTAILERRLMLGLDQAVRTAGLTQLTVPPDAGLAHLDRLLAARPLGWIVISADGPVVRRLLQQPPGVAVSVYEDLQPQTIRAGCGVDRVASGHAEGGAALVRWLAARGRRRLLCVDELVEPRRMAQAWRAERRAGILAACADCGCTLQGEIALPPLAETTADPVAAFSHATRLCAGFLAEHLLRSDPVDAILAVNDDATPALHAACRLLGRDAIDLVGFDNTWHSVPLFGPGQAINLAATIDRDLEAVGRALVGQVLERASMPAGTPPRRLAVASRLIEPGRPVAGGRLRRTAFDL